MRRIIVVVIFLLNSCLSGESISEMSVRRIHFGTGGGFTGETTSFTLEENGDIKNKGGIVVNKISEKEVALLFKKADEFKDFKLIKPQNLYSFTTIITESSSNKIIWGKGTTAVPTEILNLHKELINKVNQSIK